MTLLIFAAILWACFAFGAAALRRLSVQTGGFSEEFPFAVALGLGLLAYLMLAAGLLGLLEPAIGVALICSLAALGWRHALRLPREVGAAICGVRRAGWAALPLGTFLFAAFGLTLVGALAPAADNDYDGLVYHLAIPALYLQSGSIHPIPWLSHSNFPFTQEMLYLLGLLLRDQSLAKLFHFGCGWLTVIGVFAFARRQWGPRAAWLGASACAAIPLIAWEMTAAYNELTFALYSFLTIFALSRWYEKDRPGNGWLWVSALMCGLALGTKMLAGAVLVFVILAAAYGIARGPDRRRQAAHALLFLLISLAIASPWYLKSYLWTGNPVYPFFYGIFDGRYWNAERAAGYAAAQGAFGMGTGTLAFLSLPWNLTMNPQAFFDQPDRLRHFNVLVAVFGPLPLAFLPALLLARPVGRSGRMALWFALVYTATWFAMSQNLRYLIPVLPGLSACIGLSASRLFDRGGFLRSAVVGCLVLGLSSALYVSTIVAAPAVPVALGRESPSTYLHRVSALYPVLEDVSQVTPPDARIMALGQEPRLFYLAQLDRDYLLGDHAEIFTAAELSNPTSFSSALRKMRVTHLLLHRSTLRDMATGEGAIARATAGLVDRGRLVMLRDYGRLTLWAVVAPDAEERT